MKGNAADRLRLAVIALGVGAVLVFVPLIVGAFRSDGGSIDVAVINLDNYPRVDDRGLAAELDRVKASDINRLIIIAPKRPVGDAPFVCTKAVLPKSCPVLLGAEHNIVVPYGANPIVTLNALGGTEKPAYSGTLVTTVHRELGHSFRWKPALEVGLIMTIIAAGSLYITARSVRRRWPFGARTQAVPVFSVPPSPAAGPQPDHRGPSSAAIPRSMPVPMPSNPAPVRRPPLRPAPPPPPGPLPADVVAAIGVGRRVVAQTHFGPQGGYVAVGGVLLWASLEQPGEHVFPGRQLSVLTLSSGSDALVVSSRITEEVRQ